MSLRASRYARRMAAACATAAALALPAAAASAEGVQPKTYRGSQLVASPQAGWCAEQRGAASGMGLAGKKLVGAQQGQRQRPEARVRE